jgi:RHS repeat-associated protein
VRRTLDDDGPYNSSEPTDTFYSHQGGQIVLQFGNDDGLTHRYFWNPVAVDQLLADETVTDPETAGSVLWPLADHLGTIRDLASYNSTTDTTTIENHRVYDSFGNLVSETNSAVDEVFGFTGRLFDEATGLQNNLHRWYDAKTGRWMSEDPIGFDAGDTNLNRYVGNSPLNFTDPSGLKHGQGGGGSVGRPPGVPIDVLKQIYKDLEELARTVKVSGIFENCNRWVNDFELKYRTLLTSKAWHKFVKTEEVQSYVNYTGGHAVYRLTLIDGTIIEIDNGYLTGDSHVKNGATYQCGIFPGTPIPIWLFP